jgi:hypothetical protein
MSFVTPLTFQRYSRKREIAVEKSTTEFYNNNSVALVRKEVYRQSDRRNIHNTFPSSS